MGKRIIVFLIATLILFSLSPIAFPNTAPPWHAGDSWTYEARIRYYTEDIIKIEANAQTNNLCLEVKAEEGDYLTSLTGNIGFSTSIDIDTLKIKIDVKNLVINGSMLITKDELGVKSIVINMSGFLKISLAPLPLPFRGEISFDFKPPFAPIDYPVTEGKEWNTTYSEVFINVSESLINFTLNLIEIFLNFLPPGDLKDFFETFKDAIYDFFPIEAVLWETYLKCISRQNISVEAGTFDAFLISTSDESLSIYYAPSIANIIKIDYRDYTTDAHLQLRSTTYTPADAPAKPNEPEGPSRGRTGREYEYETSSTDPNGLEVQYGWDWDGDGSVDEWTDFYPSGEKVKISHVWDEKGKYEVRVKARNENGLESKWSEPHEVRIFRSFSYPNILHMIAKYFLSLIEKMIFLR